MKKRLTILAAALVLMLTAAVPLVLAQQQGVPPSDGDVVPVPDSTLSDTLVPDTSDDTDPDLQYDNAE